MRMYTPIITALLILLTSVLLGQVKGEERATGPTTRPASAKCPYGHDTIKRANVAYGLLMPTPELERDLESGNVVRGGCVIAPGISPRYVIICSTCNARFDPVMQTWERSASDPKKFDVAMSKEIASFPLPQTRQGEPPAFKQQIRDSRVVSESVSYWTRETAGQVDQRIAKAIRDLGIEAKREEYDLSDRRMTKYTFTIEKKAGEIRVLRKTDGDCHVAFEFPRPPEINPREWDKSSAVME